MKTIAFLLLIIPVTISAQEANFAGVTGSTAEASSCDLKEATGLVIKDSNGEALNCVSFTMSATIKKKKVEVNCQGKGLCDSAIKLIEALKPGATLYIDNIVAEDIFGIGVGVPAINVAVTNCGASPE